MGFRIITAKYQCGTVETSIADSKIIKAADGTYCTAVIATGQGPFKLAPAAAESFCRNLLSVSDDTSVFADNASTWKIRVAEKMNNLNTRLYNAASELHVSAFLSGCAVLLRPDKGINIVSIGNTVSIIKRSAGNEIAIGNRLDTAAYITSENGEIQAHPADIMLLNAIGLKQSVKPHASKTTLCNQDTVFLLSSGFSRYVREYCNILKDVDDLNLMSSTLIESIKTKRGLACGDAVLGIRLEEGEDAENRTADQVGVPAASAEAH